MTRAIPVLLTLLFPAILASLSFSGSDTRGEMIDSLRKTYLQPSENWPTPHLDSGIVFEELGQLPASPYNVDSLRQITELGKILFHDPRLSGSNQISCGSCHASDMNWTDGRRVSLGHDHQNTLRNTPTIENVWHLDYLFWDGRARTLEEQAPISIANPAEMNQDPALLPEKLSAIKGYYPLFQNAFGSEEITLDRIVSALATFQRTITSRKTKFDDFLMGDSRALTDEQIHGLHLFRTKARCINCHHGPFFTDQDFHNLGLTYYQRERYEDWGRYHVTKDPADVGKFKTPGLRNVMRTRPWFHNGIFDNIDGMMNMYNVGMPSVLPRPDQLDDPFFPQSSEHLQVLHLTQTERDAIVAFLHSLSSLPRRMDQPELPW